MSTSSESQPNNIHPGTGLTDTTTIDSFEPDDNVKSEKIPSSTATCDNETQKEVSLHSSEFLSLVDLKDSGCKSNNSDNLSTPPISQTLDSNVSGSITTGGTSCSPDNFRYNYFRYKLAKQTCLIGIWICIGLTSEMSGPTLPDLKDRIGVNYEEISRAMVGKSIGILVGSIFGSYLHEIIWRHSDLLNTFSLLMMSSAAFILPWSTSVASAALVFFLHGLGHGSVQIGGNIMVMHLWRAKATTAIMSLNFGFGVGALLSPWIASPFLSKAEKSDETTLMMTTISNPTTDENDIVKNNDISRIEIPYSIVGIIVLLFSFVVFGFYMKGPPEGFPKRKKSRIKDMTSPSSCSSGHNVFGTSLFICLFLYFINGVGGEKAYGKFLFSYAFEENILSKKQAYLIQSTFWISFTIGRLLGVPLTRILEVDKLIMCDIAVIVISTILLVNLASSEPLILWIFTIIIGMSMARIYPSGMAFSNLQLTMNSIGVLVLIIGAACGDFIYQYITGYLFETTGPHSLLYVMVGYGICLTISAFAMISVSKCIPHENPCDDATMEIEVDKSLKQQN